VGEGVTQEAMRLSRRGGRMGDKGEREGGGESSHGD